MGRYLIVYSSQSIKDATKIKAAGLQNRVQQIIEKVMNNPYEPPYEKLRGDMNGRYSRRISIQHRFIYRILDNSAGEKDDMGEAYDGIVKVLRMWTHYE